jgi:hypothetical protein
LWRSGIIGFLTSSGAFFITFGGAFSLTFGAHRLPNGLGPSPHA